MRHDLVSLPQLVRELMKLSGGRRVPNYRELYSMTLNGIIPAEQHNGRWYFDRDQVPTIAAIIGDGV
jgi:hypothetical protein